MSENNLSDCQNDSESADEEIEPKLKYVRMSNDLKDILQKDAACCIAVHPKFVCLGSRWGMIYLLDHQGNSIRSKEHAHSIAVNQISIDTSGDSIASCSDDGKVFIFGLYSSENDQTMNMGRLVKSIALDPNNAKLGTGRRFIIGDDKLMLYEKTFTFLSRLKPTILCESEGLVGNVSWCGQFVAWSSAIGVRVYDIQARCSLGLIQWEKSGVSLDAFRCNLRWADNRTLLIGWVDIVRICVVRKRSNIEMSNRELPEYLVDPVSTFHTDFYISGIAPLEQQLVLLGLPKERDSNNKSLRPQLHIVEYRDCDYVEVCTDSLSLKGYEEYTCNEYHLDVLCDENRFFIVAPRDVVVASPYDLSDRIKWLLQHCRYEEALEVVEQDAGRNVKQFTTVSIGKAYLDHLLDSGSYEAAGRLCLKVFGKYKNLWQEHIYKFAKIHQLRAVSPYLPRSPDCKLDPEIYEMVLYEYLKMEPQGFLTLIKEWNPSLYNTAAVTNALLEHVLVNEADKNIFMEALAIVYSYEKKYDKALSMYLKLKHQGVFGLIQKNNLHKYIHNMIAELMNLDHEKAIEILLDNKNRIPSEIVVEKLNGHEILLYHYLDALDRKDPKESAPFHGKMVRLYAVFAREKLLPFLRRSDQYPIKESLDVCQNLKFYPETVFLLDRIGDMKEALEIIINNLGDMQEALRFCQKNDDPDLWKYLISYSLNKPEYITFLLPRMGSHVDPTVLVQGIEPKLKIPGLKDSLIDMLRQCNLQVSIQEGCQKILVSDYFNLHEKLVRTQQKGLFISDELVCGACHRKLIESDPARLSSTVVYNCKHTFHKQCLPDVDSNCGICHLAKK